MVSYNVTNVWELIVLYLLVFAVLAFFSFGKSNLMRLIAHYFKFGYSDKKLKDWTASGATFNYLKYLTESMYQASKM